MLEIFKSPFVWALAFLFSAIVYLLVKLRLVSKTVNLCPALENENQQLKKMLAMMEDNVRQRLADKDIHCRQLLESKDAEYARFVREKEKLYAEMVRTLEEKFANLAAVTLENKTKDLSAANRENLAAALKPLSEQMKLFQEATQKAQKENQGMSVSIRRDVEAIGQMARDLTGFATALKSGTRVQGRAGEDILAEKLRQAGLEENVNFFLQKGTRHDRPDAQVCDTENRWIIIDSKVSLTAFAAYGEAPDEATKKARLAAHVASIRGKIDELVSRRYPEVFAKTHPERNYLPVTAMFVPHEAALMLALAEDPSLWQKAAEGNVILVTPLTLLAYLRLVYLAWQHEKQERNRQEIVDTARELLIRMNNFLTAFENFGKSIDALQREYDAAKGLMIDRPHAHTIAKAAQKLIDLHVKLENKKGKKLQKAACLTAESESADNLNMV
jgi:DNA recombination protein RmuC